MAQTAKIIKLAREYAGKTRRRSKNYTSSDRQDKMTRIIMTAIERELRDVKYFTREDLLQLTPLQSVATITRYHEVCLAVNQLVDSRQLFKISRTDLTTRGRVENGRQASERDYGSTVARLVQDWRRTQGDQPFDVMSLVAIWQTDPNLTINAKRVAVRGHLKRYARTGFISEGDNLTYIAKEQ